MNKQTTHRVEREGSIPTNSLARRSPTDSLLAKRTLVLPLSPFVYAFEAKVMCTSANSCNVRAVSAVETDGALKGHVAAPAQYYSLWYWKGGRGNNGTLDSIRIVIINTILERRRIVAVIFFFVIAGKVGITTLE